ncbi:MAG: DUF3047 domain-containing protein [Rubricoccaceae bacterium]
MLRKTLFRKPLPRRTLLLAGCLLATGMLAGAALVANVSVAAFSSMTPGGRITGLEPLRLGDARPTTYTLVTDGGQTVVRAEANNAASGLVRRIRIDPQQIPVLTWRWKAENVLERGDITRRGGDDYPARIYVIFDYPVSRLSAADRVRYRALQALGYRDVPTRALNYVWANRASETRIVPNPFTDWVQMVPVRSGPAGLGQWHTETRNVAQDYRAAFGEDPPNIVGIAIMTDSDNTRGRVVAYYGDIRMRPR